MVIFHPYAVSTPSLALGARARPGESSKELSIIFRPFTIQAWRRGMVVAYNWDSSVYFHKLYIYIHSIYTVSIYIYIWVNCNNSLTWIKAIWGWFPLLTMIPVRSQWGRYKLPRYIYIYIYIWNLWLPSYLWPVWEMETSHFIHVAAIRCC